MLPILGSVGELVCCLDAEGTEGHGTLGNHPGFAFLPCTWVFQVLLWGTAGGAFLLNLLKIKKLCAQKGAGTISQADLKKKKKKICTPLLLFCRGKRHSGSLKMPNKPLWANASQASQLALRTSSLKSMAQVLQRLAGECECQRPSQQSLLHVLPWT